MARSWWLVPLLVVSCAAKKKDKEPVVEKPTVGWYQATGWKGACYFPPAYADMGGGERRMARDAAREAMMEQWSGRRGDGVQFDPTLVENIETVFLGSPEKVEIAVVENYELCAKVMAGGDINEWSTWAAAQPARLLKGVCRRRLDDTMFFYLDIGAGWQFQASICEDDKVNIHATLSDEYRVDDGGPWINAEGDRSKPATGDTYPCNYEGCYVGQLVLRFRGESGATVIKPVGESIVFDPPEHGFIEIMVNDTTYFNNVYRTVQNIQHRTGVTYEPVD